MQQFNWIMDDSKDNHATSLIEWVHWEHLDERISSKAANLESILIHFVGEISQQEWTSCLQNNGSGPSVYESMTLIGSSQRVETARGTYRRGVGISSTCHLPPTLPVITNRFDAHTLQSIYWRFVLTHATTPRSRYPELTPIRYICREESRQPKKVNTTVSGAIK